MSLAITIFGSIERLLNAVCEPLGWTPQVDLWIVAAGILCAVAAALPGNFLLLRRLSMLGDAISHAVLPGLAAAFFISGSRHGLPMFLGAVVVGILTALLTEWIRSFGQVDEGASMGVVFTTLFALGLVMIVQVDGVDLDAGCVLYGNLEYIPLELVPIGSWMVPRAIVTLAMLLCLNTAFTVLCFKELRLSSFDPALAATLGFRPAIFHYSLMVIVAVTAVACFESVGNILVVAMFVVPPACASMLTTRLSRMVWLSVLIAIFTAVAGHINATTVPKLFGISDVSTSGMMAFTGGILFLCVALFAPRRGVVVRFVRNQLLGLRILSEDIVALMYRMEERGDPLTDVAELRSILLSGRTATALLVRLHCWRHRVETSGQKFRLTEPGRLLGRSLVRSHRLWEQYLASEAGVSMDRLHNQAEQLEHFTSRGLRERLHQETAEPQTDPHGTRIPAE